MVNSPIKNFRLTAWRQVGVVAVASRTQSVSVTACFDDKPNSVSGHEIVAGSVAEAIADNDVTWNRLTAVIQHELQREHGRRKEIAPHFAVDVVQKLVDRKELTA